MDTAQEALFRAMLNEDWFMALDGSVESPTGYFGYMSNRGIELNEIREAFEDTIESYGNPSDDELIGAWFARLDSNGIIHIEKCLNESQARQMFSDAQRIYEDWDDQV